MLFNQWYVAPSIHCKLCSDLIKSYTDDGLVSGDKLEYVDVSPGELTTQVVLL